MFATCFLRVQLTFSLVRGNWRVYQSHFACFLYLVSFLNIICSRKGCRTWNFLLVYFSESSVWKRHFHLFWPKMQKQKYLNIYDKDNENPLKLFFSAKVQSAKTRQKFTLPVNPYKTIIENLLHWDEQKWCENFTKVISKNVGDKL